MPAESGKPRALIVEDEAPIRELVRLHLELAGFEIEEAPDGREALARTRTRSYDLLMLDLMLPGLDGVSLCRAVRAGGPNVDTPVLMITARDTESDKVLGLESGADDYLTKPFGIREMMARVGAIMRRSRREEDRARRNADANRVQARDVVLHAGRREAHVRDKPIELTKQEFDLLYQLASRPGMVFSRTALLQHVWSDDSYVTERTVDAVISRLRRKVERDPHDPELILTAWGVGYKFVDD
jgi:DNA-binding response OmpR family regulator